MEKFVKEPWVARIEEVDDGKLDCMVKSVANTSFVVMPDTANTEPEPFHAEDDNGKHFEWQLETLSGEKIASFNTGFKEIDEANARLASTSVEMYSILKKLLDAGALPENERKHVESVLIRARGEESENTMTSEQIEACRGYLELIDTLKRNSNNWMWEPVRGRRSDFMTGSAERLRVELHMKLLKAYGFEYENETYDVTNHIPDGMTVRELHDALMLLKKKKQMAE